MHYRIPLLALCLSLPAAAPIASGAVVINEIFYNAPDEIPKLQWVELHNTDDSPVDLSGWRLVGGIEFRFPANTSIGPNGFMIRARMRTGSRNSTRCRWQVSSGNR